MSSDEMTRLRNARPEPPHASEAAKAEARAQLLLSIESADRDHGIRPRLPRVMTVIAPAAVAVTVAIVAFFVVSVRGGHHGGPASGQPGSVASRGLILASGGQTLAATRKNSYLTVIQSALPHTTSARSEESRRAVELVYGSLPRGAARDLCSPRSAAAASQLACRIMEIPSSPGVAPLFAPSHRVLIGAQTAKAITAQSSQLPGLRLSSATIREHPSGTAAADVLGLTTTSPGGGLTGQSGLELEYNSELAAGDSLKTSINLALQQVGERSLAMSLRRNGNAQAGGAFVVMDPENGQVVAMGSAPSGDRGTAPDDQAITRAQPTGSTFKPITAIAALESGDWHVNELFDDTGTFCLPGHPTACFGNAPGNGALGRLDLEQAIEVSDDVCFYQLGARLNPNPTKDPNGGQLQRWATAFGIGQPTGIDLPGAADGLLPSPASIAPAKWSVKDNIELAVGQGDLAVTPLQMAVAYAALANGGQVVTPHIATDIQNAKGEIQTMIDPGIRRHLNINPRYLQSVRTGLREAASHGSSADVMRSFPEPVYGQAGTTNTIENGVDTASAWYTAFVPATATTKPVVVVVWVPDSGYGDVAAAPVARQILSQWFSGKPGPYIAGSSTER